MKTTVRYLLFGLILLGVFGTAHRNPHAIGQPANYFAIDTVAKDLIVPWAVVFLPDQTMLFSERAGRIRLFRHNRLVAKPALTVSDVETTKKMGLLGVCIHPDFAKNQFVYIAYNYKANDTPLLKVVRYQFDSDTLRNPTVLIQDILANQNHTGCRLKFGPDRKLYVTTGDADRPITAQNLKSLNGKILRLNDDGSIPTDNPFMANDSARHEIWSYGHRNPQGLAFQPDTGHLFSSEHGPSGGDEINQIERGKNYGWPRVHHRDTAAGVVSPVLEYSPSVGPSEALFYNADAFPALKGNLLVASLRGESILRLQLDGKKIVAQERLFQKQYGRIRALAVGPDGCIYFSTSQHDPPEGTPKPGSDLILRLRPVPAGDQSRFFGPLTATSNLANVAVVSGNSPENLYQQLCASCHGPDLKGTDRAKSLFDRKHGSTRTEISQIIKHGLVGRGMPAWEGAIQPTDIEKIADYILAKTSPKPAPAR